MNVSRRNKTGTADTAPRHIQPYDEQKWLDLFSLTQPFQFGSLWWVDEDIWKSFLEGYDLDSDRKHHPGLCLQTLKAFHTLSMAVPMLQGRSRRTSRCFEVYGTSPDRTGPSCFRNFCPLPLGFFTDRRRIFKNTWKPMLDDRQKAALRRFLDQTGIMS